MPSARVDAELLMGAVLGVPRSRLPLRTPTPEQTARYHAAVRRRQSREPLQYIVGTAAFRYIEVAVGPGVFVPRPETELLVDAVLGELAGAPAPVVADLCAGSGALALAVAHELLNAQVLAVEQDGPAAAWLRRNCASSRVTAIIGDVREPALLSAWHGRVDAVLCNPPYVPADAQVAAEVRFDPAEAVFAGPDGLDLMPHVIARAGQLLRQGGVVAVEHDDSHGERVPALFAADGRWQHIADHRDLTGRPRFAVAVRA